MLCRSIKLIGLNGGMAAFSKLKPLIGLGGSRQHLLDSRANWNYNNIEIIKIVV